MTEFKYCSADVMVAGAEPRFDSCSVSRPDSWSELKRIWKKVQAAHPEANFLQSPAWARMNELIGHKVLIEYSEEEVVESSDEGDANIDVDTNTDINADADVDVDVDREGQKAVDARGLSWCLMLVKDAKRGRYLEVPGGPLIDWTDSAAVTAIFARLRAVAKQEGCVFVRLRPQLRRGAEQESLLAAHGARLAPMHLHAEHTVILDLTKSADELLAAMRRQTRYEVRRAAKLGIKVEWSNSEEIFREFHQVQLDTAARQHFVPPNLDTLLAERKAFGSHARIYVARTAEGEPIAYGLILIDGAEAEYFEAASTDLHHKLPGSYALLWQAIQDLQAEKISRFNLWGIAPADQKNHRYAGVTTFKTGFGGKIVEFIPAQDIIIKPGRYLINLLVETIRKKKRHLG